MKIKITKYLARMRDKASISQDELSKRLEVSPSWVQKRESGFTPIRFDEVVRWADACGYDIDLKMSPQGSTEGEVFEISSEIFTEQEWGQIASLIQRTGLFDPDQREYILRAMDGILNVANYMSADPKLRADILSAAEEFEKFSPQEVADRMTNENASESERAEFLALWAKSKNAEEQILNPTLKKSSGPDEQS